MPYGLSVEEAEQGIIGALLVYPQDAIGMCHEKGVSVDSFESDQRSKLYSIISKMFDKGYGVDCITVSHEIEKLNLGHLEDELNEISQAYTPILYNLPSYIAIIKKEELRRRLINVGKTLTYESEHSDEPQELLVEMQERLIDLSPKSESRSKDSIKLSIINDWVDAKDNGFHGIVTPWDTVNEKLGGIGNGLAHVLAGERGTGKSSVLASWGYFLGKNNIRTAWFPLEDGAERTWKRIAGIHGDFSIFLRDKGESTNSHLAQAEKSLEEVMKFPIFMNDQYMNIGQIRSWATNLKAKEDIQIIFIDGFKDIIRDGKYNTSIAEDEALSRSICAMARSLRIPVLIVHHVIKGSEQGNITLDNIRGSGRIIDDARTVLILQKDGLEYYLDLQKNNHGPTGRFPMRRISNRCMFVEDNQIFKEAVAKSVEKKTGVFRI